MLKHFEDNFSPVMYCYKCQRSLETHGGTQLLGCKHSLCTKCIKKETKRTKVEGIQCGADHPGVYKCSGYIPHELLESMVPEEVFCTYFARICDAAANNDAPEEEQQQPETNEIDELNLTQEEKETGWAHKAALIDRLVRRDKISREDAIHQIDNLLPLVETMGVITCQVCLDDEIPPGEGIVLKDCLHMFCKNCIRSHIEITETSEVICPFVKDEFRCEEPLKGSEVRALVSREEYEKHFEELSLREAESKMTGVFHCLTPNCKGFAIAEGLTRGIFQCEVCNVRNCLECKVIHEGTCAEFKQRVADEDNLRQQRENEQISVNAINQNVASRMWRRCPSCQAVIEKNQGCDHMTCKCGRHFSWSVTGTLLGRLLG